jgi:DNA-binding SARP family transcriptional activator
MFGTLRVARGHDVLGPGDLGGLKPRELLGLLLLARGHPVRKTDLVDALWPNGAPHNPFAALESYVSVLRKHLFDDRLQARRVLATMPGAYRFGLDGVTIDLDRFDQLIAQAERTRESRLALLLEAVELATGDVLEDAGHLRWVETERDLYRDRVARAHLLIAADLLTIGDPVQAAQHGERVLRIRPHSEEAFHVIMLANHALGYSDLARRAFHRCRSLLANELNCDCTTDTEDLAAAIDAGVPASALIAARWPVGRGASPSTTSAASDPADEFAPAAVDRRSPQRRLPFFGRSTELTLLRDRCSSVAESGLQLVVIHGADGIGKTALLDQFRSTFDSHIGRISYAASGTRRPTMPLAPALSDALSGTPGSRAAAGYASAQIVGSASTRVRLGDVIAEHGPLTFLLDDLHWADRATLETVDWLAREQRHLPVAIVATIPTDQLCTAHAQALVDLADDVIHLRPIAPSRPSDIRGLDAEMFTATGGIPELLADHWRWTQAGGSGPSPSIRDRILRIARGLDEPDRTLLVGAVLLEGTFRLIELRRANSATACLDLDQVEPALQRLCAAELINQSASEFSVRAGLVRDVLRQAADPAMDDRVTTDSSNTRQHTGISA